MADPRVDRLKHVPLFSHLSDKQLRFIATQVEELDFPAGRVLCREGHPGGDFFVMLSGAADVTRGERHINTMREGDFFGEIALVDGGERTATVTTTSPSRCLVLGPSQFRNVVHQDGDLAYSIMRALCSRLRAAGSLPAD
ncbi:MAG TPA: cyclic nucleotide-binding domain-containing protein [Candidatus Limnocylindria bacterium]